MLGTEVSIKVFSPSNQKTSLALSEAFNEIKRIEDVASIFKETSELSYINSKAPYEPVKVGNELFYLIEKGLEMCWISNGAFDITATSLSSKDGYEAIVLSKQKKEIYFTDKNCKIDLGAYAKGYAVDRAIEILRAHSIKNAIVDAGGDMRLIGLPVPHREWTVGIRNPQKSEDIFKIIKIGKEAAVTTSGNYLRKHIIPLGDRNPSVLSVTVIAQTALEADLLSTTLFNMRKNERLELMKNFGNIEVLVIKKEKEGGLELIKEVPLRDEDVIKKTNRVK